MKPHPILLLSLALLPIVSCADSSSNTNNSPTNNDNPGDNLDVGSPADTNTGADTGASADTGAGADTNASADTDEDTRPPDTGSPPDADTDTMVDTPEGLIGIDDLSYAGAFRLKPGEYGESSIDYAVGVLAFNPANRSLFIAGHAHHNAIAEYPTVSPGMQDSVEALPVTDDPLQNFTRVLDTGGNPDELDRITGMLWVDGALIVNAEQWYDAAANNTDTTLVLADANDLGARDGYFKLGCGAHCAGYMGPIPEGLQGDLGAAWFTGWSSVYSIVSRYSVGPSLWTFDPTTMLTSSASANPNVITTGHMNFAYPDAISERALEWGEQGTDGPFPPADPVWNPLSRGRYGFFVEGTRTFAVIGSTAGLESGIGYKAVQSDGGECGGPCPYEPNDYTNYYWLFDVDDIRTARALDAPRPYAFGAWEVPFDGDGQHRILGATLDAEDGVLYLALESAAQVGDYDRPPLIVTYALP